MAVKLIQQYLKANMNETKIIETFKAFCLRLRYAQKACIKSVDEFVPHMIDILSNSTTPQEVCTWGGFCVPKLDRPLLCAGGPLAWCRDSATARLCGKTGFCARLLLTDSRPLPVARRFDCGSLVGSQARLCADRRVARLCGLDVSGCPQRGLDRARATPACAFCRQLLAQRLMHGSDSLQCNTFLEAKKAQKCNLIRDAFVPGRLPFDQLESHCQRNRLCDDEATEKREEEAAADRSASSFVQTHGSDPCAWGPSVVCRDWDMATRCGKLAMCQQQVWGTKRPITSPGAPLIDCTQPLERLCFAPEQLRHCGPAIRKQCEERATTKARETRRHQLECTPPFKNLCSGADMERVRRCGMVEYCQAMGLLPAEKVEEDKEKETGAAGQDNCQLFGRAYACLSLENAKECGRVEDCQRNVWMVRQMQ